MCINVFQESLDRALLKEFLRAVQEMEAFCTPSQLPDMELFTQSVRNQWEVGCIFGFCMQFSITSIKCNGAANLVILSVCTLILTLT